MNKIAMFLVFTTLVSHLQAQQKTKPAGNPVAGTSLLYGIFCAPAGTSIVLQNNGKDDLTLIAQKENGKVFTSNNFSFTGPLPDGTKFKVNLKKTPPGQTGKIYAGADGIMPQKSNALRVGFDFTYDLVSRGTNDATFSSFYESNNPAVGGYNGEEGRYITFITSAQGFAGSTGKHRQVIWRDRNTGITKLISSASNGEEGNGDSYAPAISGDGKSVAFESYSSNLVPGDQNAVRDIFLWHSETNKMERVSIAPRGKEANAESYEPSVSGDGNFVAFTSAASNISTTEKGTSNNNVFLYDLRSDTTIMISIDPTAKKGGGGSNPSISFNGNRIAFYSHTATLVTDDKNELWDIFLWEKNILKLKRVSLTADGKERNQGNESANRIVYPAISANGRYIAFATTATNMIPGDLKGYQHVYVYDDSTGSIVIASKTATGTTGNADSPIEQGEKIAISFDGAWVAFSTNASNLGVPPANILMHNMRTNENKIISSVAGSSVGRPSISCSGGYVVFGIGGKLDNRFPSSGIFANYTGIGSCRSCPE